MSRYNEVEKIFKNIMWSMVVIVVTIILLLPILNLPEEIYVGLVVGLAGWLISYYLQKLFERDELKRANQIMQECLNEISETKNKFIEYRDREFENHKQDTTKILDVVQNKSLSLISSRRDEVDVDYNNYFENANQVKISGIANGTLIRRLYEEQEAHPLIKMLKIGNNSNVQILMAHPKSEFVKIRNYKEGTQDNSQPCSTDIECNINLLSDLAKQYENTALWDTENELRIVLSYTPFDSAITYIKKALAENKDSSEKQQNEILLMGPIYDFEKKANLSPLYQIPKSSDLFNNCVKNFESIFKEYKYEFTIFEWNKNGARFYDSYQDRSPNFILKNNC
ncbi:hypothetical protein Lepto7376_2082 [[Leptolyngbya] sp. PCC 7376]|uniref:hypothetical protein n=1 Tax=[Leptolyngbya] sp. PCC 7376 TaxID=111781 RepID=UPI00029F0EF0|nr:hypothetical protein [[Leptolyngbya] sp. PCC 7376]AFY38380.1 hypothetical protein Lepto7376_2082 [[Leptolyngbya] sp. PCC 7376]